ncbi:MAG: BT_2262 family domain-containing protein [Bacteroides sp.]
MKKILYTLLLCLSTGLFVACEDETSQDLSQVTHYISFDMQGEQRMLIPLGTPYVEPGVTATEGDEDVTSKMTITGSVDGNSAGLYKLTYSATNKDGFSSSITRTVIIYDPDVSIDISGTYTVASGTYRFTPSSGAQVGYNGYNITLTQTAPGIFYMSDYMAGYYDQRAGYGSAYAMKGYMKLNPDNTLEALNGDVAGWGDSLDFFDDGIYDPETNTISYALGYAGIFIFYVTLTK